jgi:hypothetical protein
MYVEKRQLCPATNEGGTVSQSNLRHVLYTDCDDPDCELHNPDVAYTEEVINSTELAFYIAGTQAFGDHKVKITEYARNVYDELVAESKTKT